MVEPSPLPPQGVDSGSGIGWHFASSGTLDHVTILSVTGGIRSGAKLVLLESSGCYIRSFSLRFGRTQIEVYVSGSLVGNGMIPSEPHNGKCFSGSIGSHRSGTSSVRRTSGSIRITG